MCGANRAFIVLMVPKKEKKSTLKLAFFRCLEILKKRLRANVSLLVCQRQRLYLVDCRVFKFKSGNRTWLRVQWYGQQENTIERMEANRKKWSGMRNKLFCTLILPTNQRGAIAWGGLRKLRTNWATCWVWKDQRNRLIPFFFFTFFWLGGIPSYTREYGSFWLCGVISGAETELFH